MIDRGDGYYEAEHGVFNASLIYDDGLEMVEIARNDGDIIIAYNEFESHKEAIEEWADEYGYEIDEIEWRD